jgi:hypothetical protein
MSNDYVVTGQGVIRAGNLSAQELEQRRLLDAYNAEQNAKAEKAKADAAEAARKERVASLAYLPQHSLGAWCSRLRELAELDPSSLRASAPGFGEALTSARTLLDRLTAATT